MKETCKMQKYLYFCTLSGLLTLVGYFILRSHIGFQLIPREQLYDVKLMILQSRKFIENLFILISRKKNYNPFLIHTIVKHSVSDF